LLSAFRIYVNAIYADCGRPRKAQALGIHVGHHLDLLNGSLIAQSGLHFAQPREGLGM
jgi:hypothetical protein